MIGETFRHKLLPCAVLYFTDEADQGEDIDSDDEEESKDFIVEEVVRSLIPANLFAAIYIRF